MITTRQAAIKLGIANRTVTKWCRILGVRKVGRDYVILPADLERIRKTAHDRPGRPKERHVGLFERLRNFSLRG